MIIKKISNEYFEALGEPKPGKPFGLIDEYRFKLAASWLKSGSVLDIGTYFGDFLRKVLSQNSDREVYGTEINKKRRDISNRNLKKSIVRIDYRNGSLSTFEDGSTDNIVCTEAIEHIPNHNLAVRELCRVARKRIIVTVPFNEKISYQLCIHCHRYTPNSGHLHVFNYGDFSKLIPPGWKITEEFSFANKMTRFIAKKLPQNKISEFLIEKIDCLLSHVRSRENTWLFIVIDKDK